MVSTRGPKFKFSDGEKVLCYEPDPTKAKVLYDSKVLNVIVNKDQRGRKAVEYLIHFQGWNSSWDRCVTEEYVLKDTEENRQLQRDLAQKAQLQLGAYLYRRERKKRSHKFSEQSTESGSEAKRRARSSGSRATSGTTGSSEEGSSEQNEDYDSEDTEDSVSSSENSSEDDGDDGSESTSSEPDPAAPLITIDLTRVVKTILEDDAKQICVKKKLAVLPAQPTVISIIENWVHHYSVSKLTSMPNITREINIKPAEYKKILETTVREINLCREIADSVRIYFDCYVYLCLCYNEEEKAQYRSMFLKAYPKCDPPSECTTSVKEEDIDADVTVKEEIDDPEYAHLPPFKEQDAEGEKASAASNTKRTLRSSRLSSAEEPKASGSKSVDEPKPETGNISSLNSLASTSSRGSSPQNRIVRMTIPPTNSAQVQDLLDQVNRWRLMKEGVDRSAMPSNCYGAIHLLRLFVRIPEIFGKTDLQGPKLKLILRYLHVLMGFMEMHREWYGEQFYM